jgi:hypothetical protein
MTPVKRESSPPENNYAKHDMPVTQTGFGCSTMTIFGRPKLDLMDRGQGWVFL